MFIFNSNIVIFKLEYFNSNIFNYLFFVPECSPPHFGTTFIHSQLVANLNKSGVADKAAFGFLLADALPILLANSNALTVLLATFFPKLTVALPTLLNKSFHPSPSIVASLTVTDLILLQITQDPFNILVLLAVTTPRILLVPL